MEPSIRLYIFLVLAVTQKVLLDLGRKGSMFLFESRVIREVLKVEAELFTRLINEGVLAIAPATLRQFVQHVETDEMFILLFIL